MSSLQSPALFPDSELVSEETRKKWAHYIEFLTAHPDWMTFWEMEFTKSIADWLSGGRDLTLNQSFKLGQVFHRVEERIG
jgi:hypothetical protein